MKTLALVAKQNKPEAQALAQEIVGRYPQCRVLAERPLAGALGVAPLEDNGALAAADLMVVLGGDGTLIHGARLLQGRPVPILGVNLGSLGFLTEVPQTELFAMLELTLEGKVQTESRMKLSCRLVREGAVLLEDEVLNDLVINKGALARIADHETSIDGRFVTTYKSDGVIVATPTGSTAYSLSANGPIVHPTMEGVIVTPICPHALNQRALVIPGEQQISITLRSESADVYLTLDGQVGHPLATGDRLEVRRSPNRVVLVKNPRMDYFGILRQKLHWGAR